MYDVFSMYCTCVAATFCIWRPTEHVKQLIRESASLKVYHLQASEGRYGNNTVLYNVRIHTYMRTFIHVAVLQLL